MAAAARAGARQRSRQPQFPGGRQSCQPSRFALASYALGAPGRELVVLAAKDYFFNTNARRFVVSNFTRLIPFDRERAQLDSLDDAWKNSKPAAAC